MALRMAGLGAKVGVVGRRQDPLRETVEAIRAGGRHGRARAVRRARSRGGLGGAWTRSRAELGPVNQLINNAAGNFLSASEDLSPNAFNSVVQIVLYGTFHARARSAGA